MAINPPAMTTSLMKPLLFGNFTSLRSLSVIDRVLPNDKTHLDTPVVTACRCGGCRVEVAAHSLGTNHHFCYYPLFKEPCTDEFGSTLGKAVVVGFAAYVVRSAFKLDML